MTEGIPYRKLTEAEQKKFYPFELWRQDDNGNKVIISRVRFRVDAVVRCQEYLSGGHKQMYWVEECKTIT